MARTLTLQKNGVDPVGAPDFTLPVSILAQIIESLKVDIVAQTIPKLEIDIASVASGVTFNVAQSGAWTVNAAQTGAWTINIGNPLDASGNLKTSIQTSVTLNVNIVGSTTLNINIASITSGVTFNVAQSGTWTINIGAPLDASGNLKTAIQSSVTLNVNITGSTTLNVNISSISSGVTFNVNITGSTTLNVNISSISSGVTFNVNITGSTTLNVSVTSSVDINVKTSGGANIIIDKLTQGAYTERQVALINDNGVSSPTAPPYYLTGTAYRGKFFPRGCRGEIRSLLIYCTRTGTGTLTLSMSPRPGMGPIASVTIGPGSSWDWAVGWVHSHWNYDSLFIWVSACSSDVSYGYDTTAPLDMYRSDDSGATWYWTENRLFIRVQMASLTVGDLPVSGTVNTIAVPNLASGKESGLITVYAGGTYYVSVDGAGSLLIAYFRYCTAASTTVLRPTILCDGVEALPMDGTIANWRDYLVGLSHSDIYIAQWDTTNNYYTLAVALPLKFRRKLQVGFKNGSASDYGAYLHFSYELIK